MKGTARFWRDSCAVFARFLRDSWRRMDQDAPVAALGVLLAAAAAVTLQAAPSARSERSPPRKRRGTRGHGTRCKVRRVGDPSSSSWWRLLHDLRQNPGDGRLRRQFRKRFRVPLEPEAEASSEEDLDESEQSEDESTGNTEEEGDEDEARDPTPPLASSVWGQAVCEEYGVAKDSAVTKQSQSASTSGTTAIDSGAVQQRLLTEGAPRQRYYQKLSQSVTGWCQLVRRRSRWTKMGPSDN
eukprot:scaffold1397_cov254-Pinguiococcus_pyrenoidosus.AAC.5